MNKHVNHPPHYNAGSIECIDAIKAAVSGLSGFEGFCAGNAMKYLWRWKHKGGAVDLEKAAWFIQKLIDGEKGGTALIQPLKIKVRRADNPGIFHNSREDVRRLGEALNKSIDKINELTDVINRLMDSEEKER